ncbi:UNVERIFIED_CONTAM: hypothetical protein GTU68_057192 [Idotea baltica]|nr:hypothetical protein [Idotea baltica]
MRKEKRSNNLPVPADYEFQLRSPFKPKGDQPKAISKLTKSLKDNVYFQTVLGVTGSGKTFTVANVIQNLNRPALVIAPNKTLAAQLYSEFKEFFPENAVSYFVSYYDYYQPEAYVPSTNTYIEKDSSINEEIDKMRHSATCSVLERKDAIVIASVSCIYGLGAPEQYFALMLFVEINQELSRDECISKLLAMQYKRSEIEFTRGSFRVRGDTIDIFPASQDAKAIRIVFFGDEVEELLDIDALSGQKINELSRVTIYPVSHFVTDKKNVELAVTKIKKELKEWLPRFKNDGKVLEAERLKQRTLYDCELLMEVGFCPGVENYSRHMDGRDEGGSPATLLDYFSEDFVLIIDESHVTIPQIGGMYKGDRARKTTLVDYGFRLPSALDNRPLKAEEFWQKVGQVVCVSATPGEFELEKSQDNVIQLINRPTGLVDPEVEIKPATNQVDDLIHEIRKTIELGDRVLVTTLTKKMSEDLADYLNECQIACRYLHSDINTIERVEILKGLRAGDFDVLIGINLLREGLDLVEVSLVAILDADKEGFLRSKRSLIQTMGRAARNLRGRVIMYADRITRSMQEALDETKRRRDIQLAYNKENSVIPESAKRADQHSLGFNAEIPKDEKSQKELIKKLTDSMLHAAKEKEFERAAKIRDTLSDLKQKILLS